MKVPKENVVDLREVKAGKTNPPKQIQSRPQRKLLKAKPKTKLLRAPRKVAERITRKKSLAKDIERASTLYQFDAFEEKNRINFVILGIAGIAAAALIIYFALSTNYLASLLFFLAGITLAFQVYSKNKSSRETPKSIKCKIKAGGVQVGDIMYPYENLKSFWIFYDPPYHQELSIRSRKVMTGFIKIPLGDADPVKIRKKLIKFIPEKRQEEALVDVVARIIGL